eukprot:CAMPEP_0197322626 /NCGR_PEP_ID=MMETSP0891-20130614/70016_1 /TAXON_ID=44058 ORGANISM="Aureoumbra lagunensis, Strain CCMP1510" /NCGR_SAMPLE_ID=MMETSP0891 /ASSEMBLY_ACC=CAM_ASM_000534 /LENGTH=576 /DNA_ID=CAMNT_0042815069 /DNA_START=36 /DNA_END=1766 /DNA_ORIENTATION=-
MTPKMMDLQTAQMELGLQQSASFEDIKKKYHEKMLVHHPDKGGRNEDCQKIIHAFEVLVEEERVRIRGNQQQQLQLHQDERKHKEDQQRMETVEGRLCEQGLCKRDKLGFQIKMGKKDEEKLHTEKLLEECAKLLQEIKELRELLLKLKNESSTEQIHKDGSPDAVSSRNRRGTTSSLLILVGTILLILIAFLTAYFAGLTLFSSQCRKSTEPEKSKIISEEPTSSTRENILIYVLIIIILCVAWSIAKDQDQPSLNRKKKYSAKSSTPDPVDKSATTSSKKDSDSPTGHPNSKINLLLHKYILLGFYTHTESEDSNTDDDDDDRRSDYPSSGPSGVILLPKSGRQRFPLLSAAKRDISNKVQQIFYSFAMIIHFTLFIVGRVLRYITSSFASLVTALFLRVTALFQRVEKKSAESKSTRSDGVYKLDFDIDEAALDNKLGDAFDDSSTSRAKYDLYKNAPLSTFNSVGGEPKTSPLFSAPSSTGVTSSGFGRSSTGVTSSGFGGSSTGATSSGFAGSSTGVTSSGFGGSSTGVTSSGFGGSSTGVISSGFGSSTRVTHSSRSSASKKSKKIAVMN